MCCCINHFCIQHGEDLTMYSWSPSIPIRVATRSCVVLYLASWWCAGQSWSSLWGVRTCWAVSFPISWLCVCKRSSGFYLIILNFCVISYAARAPSWPGANWGFLNSILCFLCRNKESQTFWAVSLPRPLTRGVVGRIWQGSRHSINPVGALAEVARNLPSRWSSCGMSCLGSQGPRIALTLRGGADERHAQQLSTPCPLLEQLRQTRQPSLQSSSVSWTSCQSGWTASRRACREGAGG